MSLVHFSFSIFNSPFLPPNSYLPSVTEFCRQHCHAHCVISRERWSAKETSPPNRLFMRARMIWLAMMPPAHKIGQ